MPKIDTNIDDDLHAEFAREAEEQGVSKAALLRQIIQARYERQESAATADDMPAVAMEISALRAKMDALTRYLCLAHPLDEWLSEPEIAAAKRNEARVKEWAKSMRKPYSEFESP